MAILTGARVGFISKHIPVKHGGGGGGGGFILVLTNKKGHIYYIRPFISHLEGLQKRIINPSLVINLVNKHPIEASCFFRPLCKCILHVSGSRAAYGNGTWANCYSTTTTTTRLLACLVEELFNVRGNELNLTSLT